MVNAGTRNRWSAFAAWWQSEWGPGPVIRLALPLMISAGFISITLFTDRTLLFWQSELGASAAMGAGTLYWSLTCFPIGLLGYLSTFVSQYRGAAQGNRIGVAYQHAHALALALVPLFVLGIIFARSIYNWAGHSSELARLEAGYLQVLLIGGIGFLFYSVQCGLLTGQGRTGTVLAMDAVGTVVNLVLDVVLIFGFGPIPELGVIGAGLATTISFWMKIPIASWVIRRDAQLVGDYRVGTKSPWEIEMFRRLIVYGGPAGLQMLAEAGCFSVIMLQVGRLGELEMAATTLALGLNVLAFVPLIGLGIGVGVLVGQRLTEGRIDLARRTVTCALGITIVYTSLFAGMLGLAPSMMTWVYAWGTPPERFAQIQPLLLPLLGIIAMYCILDGWQVVFVGAIKGAGDTWFVLGATTIISCVVICCGMVAQSILGESLMLWWYTIAGWVAVMGLAFSARYFSGSWETKRVIETPSGAQAIASTTA